MSHNSISFACHFLEENNIQYVLINDFLGGSGHDVDLYIPKTELPKLNKLLKEKVLFKRAHPSRHINHHYYYLKNNNTVIVLDVKFNLSFFDPDEKIYRIALFESEVLEKSEKNRIGRRPIWWHAILLYGAHCGFLERGSIESRHIDNLVLFINTFLDEAEDEKRIKFANSLLDIISKFKCELVSLPKALRRLLRDYFVEISPADQQIDIDQIKDQNSDFQGGYSVLFLGCDGSGKSTLIKSTEKNIQIPVKVIYGGVGKAGWRIPIVRDAREQIKKKKILQKLKFHKIWLLFLFPIELYMRIWRGRKFRKRKLVLFDRFPDFPFKPNAWSSIRKIYEKLLPTPDLIVYLNPPIETLVERKPEELSLQEARKKIKYEELIASFYKKNGTRIINLDTSKFTAEKCTDIIIEEIWTSEKFRKTVFNLPD